MSHNMCYLGPYVLIDKIYNSDYIVKIGKGYVPNIKIVERPLVFDLEEHNNYMVEIDDKLIKYEMNKFLQYFGIAYTYAEVRWGMILC